MKTPKLELKGKERKADGRNLLDSLSNRIEQLNPMILIGIGGLSLILAALLLFTGGASQQDNEATLKRAEQVIGQVSEYVQNFSRVLEDQQVQELGPLPSPTPKSWRI